MATSEKPITTKPAPTKSAAGSTAEPNAEYAHCEECGAPLDEKQRYCVSCGARRRDASAPTSRYFATAARRNRRGSGRAAGPSGARAAAVLFFVVLPIAVAIGVLVGKGNGGGNNDQQLAEALKSLQASGGGNTALASTAAATPITSDFTLDQGYTVELKTLPVDGTDQAAVDAAKKAATGQGAADVGIINISEFAVTPAPPANTYVLFSGEFKSKAEATKALGKLKGKFKDAQVVSVEAELGRPGPAGRQDAVRRRPSGRGLHARRAEGRLGHRAGPAAGPEGGQELRRLAEGPARRDRGRRQRRRGQQPGGPGER